MYSSLGSQDILQAQGSDGSTADQKEKNSEDAERNSAAQINYLVPFGQI